MTAHDFRPGDIVEVTPTPYHGVTAKPFRGVVTPIPRRRRETFGSCIDRLQWVYVQQSKPYRAWPGGWYPEQCRLIKRPAPKRIPRVPENIVLGES